MLKIHLNQYKIQKIKHIPPKEYYNMVTENHIKRGSPLANYAPGTRVIIRDTEWLIKRVETSSDKGYCLEVVGISPFVKDKEARFLTKLEESIKVIDPLKTELKLDTSGHYEDTRLYLETMLRNTPISGKSLSIGTKGAMDLIPFQTDPAKMALKEPRCRILIADAVGLGKTIEAGILLTELMARGRGKRMLVVALKSMLTQFQKEMWSRFSIPLVRLDSAGITRIKNRIPTNYNPFYYYDKTIISIDTLKRENDYRVWLENSYWDIIVIDEAHNVAQRSGSSQRFKLSERLSNQCDSLIMLSATPHDGKKESFASLMTMLNPASIDTNEYGPEDIKGMFIRRFKKDIKDQVAQAFPEREITNHHCTATAKEDAVFSFLKEMRYADQVRTGRSGKLLFKTVLEKSLLSSPRACLITVKNRLKRLGNNEEKFAENIDEIGELDKLARMLEDIQPKDISKVNDLFILLKSKEYGWSPKKVDDRIVIFTERIETMKFLYNQILDNKILQENQISQLYGGMSDMDVQETVENFGKEASPLRMIIASDIAAEGINLHYLSHRMIHFDIPWSLMTFQQRNGRIDRYGQIHKPLITYLLTDYDYEEGKGDQHILELLIRKDKQVQENIGDPGEFTGIYDSEEEEIRVGLAIEANLSDEEAEEVLKEDGIDFFAELFGADSLSFDDSEEETPDLPRLFDSDFNYYNRVVKKLSDRLDMQFDSNSSTEVLTITPIKGFKNQEKNLPDRVIPGKGESYYFTTDKKLVMDDIADARKEETLWPKKNLLWDQHPLLTWLRNDLETLFGRNETPLATDVPSLNNNETLIIFYGQIPNKRGLTVINTWKGLLFEGNKFKKNLTMDEVIKSLRLSKNNLPNSASEIDILSIKKLLPEALKEAKNIIAEERAAFNRDSAPFLIEHQKRLGEIRDKKLKQLKLNFSEAIERNKGHVFDIYNQTRHKAEQDYDSYIDWIKNHMKTEEEGYIQFTAIFTGQQYKKGELF